MHVVWYTAMSIDGRIAGPGDDMSFLDSVQGDGEDSDFADFISGVDALVVGGGTLRWLHSQGHDLPHRGLPIWLVSHDEQLAARASRADPDGTPVARVEGDVAAILDAIGAAGHERVWISGGGDIAGQAAGRGSHRRGDPDGRPDGARRRAGDLRSPLASRAAIRPRRVPRVRPGIGAASLAPGRERTSGLTAG